MDFSEWRVLKISEDFRTIVERPTALHAGPRPVLNWTWVDQRTSLQAIAENLKKQDWVLFRPFDGEVGLFVVGRIRR